MDSVADTVRYIEAVRRMAACQSVRRIAACQSVRSSKNMIKQQFLLLMFRVHNIMALSPSTRMESNPLFSHTPLWLTCGQKTAPYLGQERTPLWLTCGQKTAPYLGQERTVLIREGCIVFRRSEVEESVKFHYEQTGYGSTRLAYSLRYLYYGSSKGAIPPVLNKLLAHTFHRAMFSS